MSSSRGAPIRLIFLTHYYPPEAGAPQTRISTLAAGLAGRGFEVTVHTCPPHYPDGEVPEAYRGLRTRVERSGGVQVVRTPVLAAPNRGFTRRLIDHASFATSATALGRRAGRADVVVVESPPLFLAGAAPAYAQLHGARLIVNIADLWPDSAVELGALTNPAAIRAARALERMAYRSASAITAPTAGIVASLEARPESAGKATRMPPFVEYERFDAEPLERKGGPLQVLYAGTTGMAQGLEVLLEAARRVGPEVATVRIAGGGAEAPELRRRVAGIPNVEMLGVRPASEIPRLYREADVAAVLLRDVPLFHGALPTKLFEAMAAGRPLVLAAAGESAELVEGSESGVVVPPEDPSALAGALSRLAAAPRQELQAMGEAGRRTAREHDLGPALDRWGTLLERVSASGLGSRP